MGKSKSSLAGSQTSKSKVSKEVWIPEEYRRKQIERDLMVLRENTLSASHGNRPGTAGAGSESGLVGGRGSTTAVISASSSSFSTEPVSPKELKELKRVFDRLCQYSSSKTKQSQSSPKSFRANPHIRAQDIAAALRDLGIKATKQEVLDMLWEADEKNDGVVDWDEMKLMFERCVHDDSGREPASFYYVVQFMIFDRDADGLVGIDDTMDILYARMGAERMEEIIDELFHGAGNTPITDGGASLGHQGRPDELDFASFRKAWSRVLLTG